MATTYNPRDTRYRTNDDRYTDWVAQGRPSTDVNGNELDVRGEVIGSDAWTNQYYQQNAADLSRIYGTAGVQATLNNTRDRSAEDPWNTALRGGAAPSPITGRTMPQPVVGNQPSPVQLPAGSRQPGTMPGGISRAQAQQTNPNYGGTPVVNNQPSPVQIPTRQNALATNSNYGGYRPAPSTASNVGILDDTETTSQGVPKVGEVTSAGNVIASGTGGTQQRPFNVSQNGMLTLNGEELGRNDPRLWGRSGNLSRGTNTTTSAQNPNPDYWVADGSVTDDAGNTIYNWRVRPEVTARLNGRVQVSQNGVGGYDEVIDPTKVEYDPEFGFLTTPDNISQDDPGPARRAMFIRNAILAMGAAGATGLLPGTPGGLALPGAETIAGTGALPYATAPVVTETMLGTPALSLPGAGAAAAGVASALPSLSQVANGLRTAGTVSSIINQLTNSGGGSRPSGSIPGSGGPSGNRPGGGFSIADIISNIIGGAGGNYQANRNIGHFTDLVNDMLTRGDPYSGERAAAIQRLRNLEANPGSITSNPLFSSMNDKSQMDLQRIMSARGLSVSGNEMGALQENFLANMNKFYGDEWNRNAREAGVFFDPSTIASAGMRAGGDIFGARTNRDAGLQALIAAALTGRGGGGQGGGGAGNTIADIINRIFGGDSGDGEDGGDSGDGMSDEDWSNWWDSWIEGNYGGDNPVGDAGDYNG